MKPIHKLTSILLSFALISVFQAPVFAAETAVQEFSTDPKIKVVQGRDVVSDNIEVLDNGNYVCITTDISELSNIDRAYPEKEKTVSFKHQLVDRNGIEMATLLTIVTGVYDQADNYAELTEIDAVFSGAFASYYTYSTSIDGDTGTLYLYYNGLPAGSLTYKIYTNGTIRNI